MEKSTIAKAVIATLVSAALAGGTGAAMAAKSSSKHVKCYGIAKKGKNHCGTSHHSCSGQAKKNYAPDEWVYTSKSRCLKKGGSVNKPKKMKCKRKCKHK